MIMRVLITNKIYGITLKNNINLFFPVESYSLVVVVFLLLSTVVF